MIYVNMLSKSQIFLKMDICDCKAVPKNNGTAKKEKSQICLTTWITVHNTHKWQVHQIWLINRIIHLFTRHTLSLLIRHHRPRRRRIQCIYNFPYSIGIFPFSSSHYFWEQFCNHINPFLRIFDFWNIIKSTL
jgi:hypothetical protein